VGVALPCRRGGVSSPWHRRVGAVWGGVGRRHGPGWRRPSVQTWGWRKPGRRLSAQTLASAGQQLGAAARAGVLEKLVADHVQRRGVRAICIFVPALGQDQGGVMATLPHL
jgi:hypothetical protein